jgi:hypothetical protein
MLYYLSRIYWMGFEVLTAVSMSMFMKSLKWRMNKMLGVRNKYYFATRNICISASPSMIFVSVQCILSTYVRSYFNLHITCSQLVILWITMLLFLWTRPIKWNNLHLSKKCSAPSVECFRSVCYPTASCILPATNRSEWQRWLVYIFFIYVYRPHWLLPSSSIVYGL